MKKRFLQNSLLRFLILSGFVFSLLVSPMITFADKSYTDPNGQTYTVSDEAAQYLPEFQTQNQPTQIQTQTQTQSDSAAKAGLAKCLQQGGVSCGGNDSQQNGGLYGNSPNQTAPTNIVSSLAGAADKIGATVGIQAAMQAITAAVTGGVTAGAAGATVLQALYSVPVSNPLEQTLLAQLFADRKAASIKDDLHQFTLKAVAKMVAETIIHQIAQSIVTWINSGFNGGPAFVTDPEGFMINTADQVSGKFIAGAGLNALCQPFNLQIRIALAGSRGGNGNGAMVCTLSKVLNNAQNFANFTKGSFSQNGGWNSWFSITQNNSNNPYGAYIESSNALERIVTTKVNSQLKQLDWGQGFKSKVVCDGPYEPNVKNTGEGGGDESKGQSSCSHQSIATPGTVLREQLNQTVNGDMVTLENVHDIDEIVNALVGQLVNVVVTSANGLSGVSTASVQHKRNDGTTYTTPFTKELINNVDPSIIESIKQPLFQQIDSLKNNLTNKNDAAVSKSIEGLRTAGNGLNTVRACFTSKLSANRFPPFTDNQKQNATQQIQDASSTIATFIIPSLNSLQNGASSTVAILIKLEDIRQRLTAAKDQETVSALGEELGVLAGSPEFTATADTTSIDNNVATINAAVTKSMDTCNTAYGTVNPDGSYNPLGNTAGTGNFNNGNGTYNYGNIFYNPGNSFY